MNTEEIIESLKQIDDYGLFIMVWETITFSTDAELVAAVKPIVAERQEKEGRFRNSAINKEIMVFREIQMTLIERSLTGIETAIKGMLKDIPEESSPTLTVIDGGLSDSSENT